MPMRTSIALIVAAVVVGAIIMGCGSDSLPTRLVPAWLLLDEGRFMSSYMTDPFASWSPDSKMLVTSLTSLKTRESEIYLWRVGGKRIESVCKGASPNFISEDEFAYLQRDDPKTKAMYARNVATGAERKFAPALVGSEFWKETVAFTYKPREQKIILRLIEGTEFYNAGTEVYDLSGKRLGEIESRASEGIVDFSSEPNGGRSAIIVRETEAEPASLQLADGKRSRGKVIAEGRITSVGWSTDAKAIAYGDSATVVAIRPSDGKRVVIANFARPQDPNDKRYVCRLSWSPDSRYLAAYVYVPKQSGDYGLIYVLDASKIKWD